MKIKYLVGFAFLSSISFTSFAKLMPNEKVSYVETMTKYVNFDQDGKITGEKNVFDRKVIPHAEGLTKERTAQLAEKAVKSIKDKGDTSHHHDFNKHAEIMGTTLEGNPLPTTDKDVATLVSTSIKVVNADENGNVTRHENIKSNTIFPNGNHDQKKLKKAAAVAHKQMANMSHDTDDATLLSFGSILGNVTDFVKAASSGVGNLVGGVAGALGNAAKGAVMGLLVP